MAHSRSALCAATALCGVIAASNAQGAIIFSYEDPSALIKEFLQHAPGGLGQPGSLTYNESIIHRFVIDAQQEAVGARTTVDATLHFINITVGPVTKVGNLFIAETSGAFEFRTTEMMPRTILSGAFTDGVLTTFFGSGSQTAARNDLGGMLSLTAGPALFDILAGVGYMMPVGGLDAGGTSSASWSLVNIEEPVNEMTLVNFPPSDDNYFPDFSADNAFVARAEIVPAPGAMVVAALPALALYRRRRRTN